MKRFAVVAVVAMCLASAGCAAALPSPSPTGANGSRPSGASAAPLPSSTPTTLPASPTSSGSALGQLPVGQIVFDRLSGSPEGDFDGMFTLGSGDVEQPVKLPFHPTFAEGIWSHDGRKLLVNSFTHPSGTAIGTMDLSTGVYTAIKPKDIGDGLDCSDWSLDERTLVCGFGSDAKVDDGIYLVDVVSGATRRLTKSPYHDTVGSAGECGGGENRGVFSPDGTQIAYEQQQCGSGPDPSSDERGSIVEIPANGGTAHVVVPFGGVRTHPGGEISWSPDGSLIAFGTQEGKLSVVAPDGSGLREIPTPSTLDGSRAIGPAWSPDGRWLLVGIGGNGLFDLFAVAADGSTSIQLTSTALTEAYTDWGAAPA